MCTEVNSAMGLQATAATKRKHELTFDSKDVKTSYTNCPPPVKTNKWSSNNNNYIDSLEEQIYSKNIERKILNRKSNKDMQNITLMTTASTTTTTTCEAHLITAIEINSISNGDEVTNGKINQTQTPAQSPPSLNSLVTSLIPVAGEVAATTPLPPTSITSVPEDSIAKLEVVAAVPCEPWSSSSAEPVDCISKLQAVAVPSDPWGSISTRSTLATTLLSADELEDDDDDFEDDYEEEESIIPTYCPLRYHTFAASTPPTHQQQRIGGNYSTAHGYSSRPNYYSEPFPQQNCSRTGNPQHMRMANGFPPQWQASNNSQQFYDINPPNGYSPQQTHSQQTIRCAENGKSYLDLGCSNTAITPNSNISKLAAGGTTAAATFSTVPPHVHPANLDVRHHLKRCCDGRGIWCNTNKNCYKDIRLKIRNLSMYKLSRFRQVSEQSLYRSVLICNTLKRIDREIEADAKEMHQAAQQQHQQAAQYHQLHLASAHHQYQHNAQQPPHLPLQSLHHIHQPQEYTPVLNCARLANMEYQQHFIQSAHYHNQSERLDAGSSYNLQKSPSGNNFVLGHSNSSNCDSSSATTNAAVLHPYDHYPFRESQSGRATPFPTCQPVITSAAAPTTTTHIASTASNTTASHNNTSGCESSDSGYAEDDSTRSINWSSVLSLSSQSALDPLNNNDLFSILPPVPLISNPATAVPVPTTPTSSTPAINTHGSTGLSCTSISPATVAINGSFTAVHGNSTSTTANSTSNTSTSTTATFTTLSTISSAATHSLTSSYVSSINSSSPSVGSTWEYSLLDMEFGLGSEFTELMPSTSCKLSSDDIFKSSLSNSVANRFSTVHDNELEQPAHIMVGS